jgi:hypothetical protein
MQKIGSGYSSSTTARKIYRRYGGAEAWINGRSYQTNGLVTFALRRALLTSDLISA